MPVLCDYRISGLALHSAEVVMCVHGIGASKHTWDGLLPFLEPHFTCVSYDLRGHGKSWLPDTDFGLEDLVDDMEALRQHLQVAQIHIIGHSLGGMIGPAFALAHPEHCLSVGLLSTAAGRTEEDSAKAKHLARQVALQGAEPLLDALVGRWFTTSFAAANADVIERRKQQVLATPAAVFATVFKIYAETEMAPWLNQVRAPCIVLTGAEDGGCNPRLNRFIDQQLPHSQLVILEHLKHAILLEAPERVATPLLAFLQSNACPSKGI